MKVQIECFCGEVVEIEAEEVAKFEITICPRCDSEICLDEAWDEINEASDF